MYKIDWQYWFVKEKTQHLWYHFGKESLFLYGCNYIFKETRKWLPVFASCIQFDMIMLLFKQTLGQRKRIHSFLLPPASDFAPAPNISLFFVNSLFSIFTFGSVGKSPKHTSNIQSSTKTNHDSARRLAPILQCYIYYCLAILTGNHLHHVHHVHQVPDEL